jgi:mannose-6-phosphate isomerase-like protein (cupin superfamily)
VNHPMTKLSGVEETEDIPAGMLLRCFDAPVAPVDLSHWRLEAGADSGDDLHSVRELWLIAAGRGEMTCGGRSLDVAAGDVVSIEPHQPHRLRNTGDGPVEVFSIWWSD